MTSIFEFAAWVLPIYYTAVNVAYTILLYQSIRSTREHHTLLRSLRSDMSLRTSLCPPVSILVPARNEEAGILVSVASLLELEYPEIEVVVINDGSTDGTLAILKEEYQLEATDIPYVAQIATAPVRRIYVSRHERRVLVLDKVSSGRKADALNAGLNVASSPYVCVIDGDALLERDALPRIMAPALNDPEQVIASGGIVRAVNGSTVSNGEVTEVRLPKGMLGCFQVLEYLRSFLLGRQGWARTGMLLIISGAFGVFRRDCCLAIGGFRGAAIGEDMDLIVRLHRWAREKKLKYKVAFVPDPVCWTEVPSTLGVLGRQRARWQNGLADLLWSNREMTFNPSYGRIGMIALPYQWLFELLAPVVEVAGWLIIGASLCLGISQGRSVLMLTLLGLMLSALLSMITVLIEEMVYRRYNRWSDLLKLIGCCFLEPFYYRPLNTYWRIRGIWSYLRGQNVWQLLPRNGLGAAPSN